MNFHAKYLRDQDIQLLRKHFDVLTINRPYQMVYENQIPQVAMILLSGSALLKSKRKIIKTIDPGILLGAYHLIHEHPVVFGCEISAKSEVLLIHKSEIIEIVVADPSDPRKLILAV